jgi:hypothetical protein
MIAKVHARLHDALQRDLPIVDLFAYPTIASLAGHIAKANGGDDFQNVRARAAARRHSMQRKPPRRERQDLTE